MFLLNYFFYDFFFFLTLFLNINFVFYLIFLINNTQIAISTYKLFIHILIDNW